MWMIYIWIKVFNNAPNKSCLPQILLDSLLNTLTHFILFLSVNIQMNFVKNYFLMKVQLWKWWRKQQSGDLWTTFTLKITKISREKPPKIISLSLFPGKSLKILKKAILIGNTTRKLHLELIQILSPKAYIRFIQKPFTWFVLQISSLRRGFRLTLSKIAISTILLWNLFGTTNGFTHSSGVSIVDFERVNVGWITTNLYHIWILLNIIISLEVMMES